MSDQRRLYLLISQTLGGETNAVESQKVRLVHFSYRFPPVAHDGRKVSESLIQKMMPLSYLLVDFRCRSQTRIP